MDINISLAFIVFIASAIITISGAVAIITKSFKKTVTKVVEECVSTKIDSLSESFHRELESLAKDMRNFMKESKANDEIAKKNMLTNARDRLNQAYELYVKEGSIGEHTMFILEEIYTNYKELNGNTFIDDKMVVLREIYKSSRGGTT